MCPSWRDFSGFQIATFSVEQILMDLVLVKRAPKSICSQAVKARWFPTPALSGSGSMGFSQLCDSVRTFVQGTPTSGRESMGFE